MNNLKDLVIQDCTDGEIEPLAPADPHDPTKPAHFDYITENIYISPSLQDSKDRKRAKRMVCDCQFDPETDEPEDACGENCLNRLLMIECGSRCPCGEYCTNKHFKRAGYADVEVFKTENKGWGLKAKQPIVGGTFVMEYCGEVCTIADFECRKSEYSKEKRRHYYFMSLKTDEILDATRKGNLSRFINHSCDPNCETQKWTVSGRLCIGFFSLRNIELDEELTFDYQFQRFGDVAQKCYCGSANCRGYLGQTKQTPSSFKVVNLHNEQGSPHSPSMRRRGRHRIQSDADSAFEKEIYDLVGPSWRLKTGDQVVAISRTMLQAETISQRVMLLQVLQATEDILCLKKFLFLHGLRLLWSWMVDSADLNTSEVLQFRIHVLQTLSHLPIVNKNQVCDSKLLPVVTRWAEPTNHIPSVEEQRSPGPVATPTTTPIQEEQNEGTVVSEADSAPCDSATVEGSEIKEIVSCDSIGSEMGKEAGSHDPDSGEKIKVEGSCDSMGSEISIAKEEESEGVVSKKEMMPCDSGGVDKEQVSCDLADTVVSMVKDDHVLSEVEELSCEAEARKTSDDESQGTKKEVEEPGGVANEREDLQSQLEVLAQDLLGKWTSLKEIFRIPKRAPSVVQPPATSPNVSPEEGFGSEEQEEPTLVRKKGRGRSRREGDHTSYYHHHHHHHQHRTRKGNHIQGHSPSHHSSSPRPSSHISSSHISSSHISSSHIPSSTHTPSYPNHQPLTSTAYQSGSGPVQSTVIVQQQGQSLYVQQQIFRNGCQTTILPTQYISAQTTHPHYVQLQQTRLSSIQPLLPTQQLPANNSPQPSQVVYTPVSHPTSFQPNTGLTTSIPSLLGPLQNPGLTSSTPNSELTISRITPSGLTPMSLTPSVSGGTSIIQSSTIPVSGMTPMPAPALIPVSVPGLFSTVNPGITPTSLLTPNNHALTPINPGTNSVLTPVPTTSSMATPLGVIAASPNSGLTPIITPEVTPSPTPLLTPTISPSVTPVAQQISASTGYLASSGAINSLMPLPSHPLAFSTQQVQQGSVSSSPLSLLPLPPPPPDETTQGLPTHWKTARDSSGKIYYYHAITRKTQWERPTEQDEGTITMELATPEQSGDEENEECLPEPLPEPVPESLSHGPHTPTENNREKGTCMPHTPDDTPPSFSFQSTPTGDHHSDTSPSLSCANVSKNSVPIQQQSDSHDGCSQSDSHVGSNQKSLQFSVNAKEDNETSLQFPHTTRSHSDSSSSATPHTPPLSPHPHTPPLSSHPQTPSLSPHPHTPPLSSHPQTPSLSPHPRTPPLSPHPHTPPLSPCPRTPPLSPHPHTPPLSPCPRTPPLSPHPHTSPFKEALVLNNYSDEEHDMTPPRKKQRKNSRSHNREKEEFRHKLSKAVICCLDQHRKSECKYGRITCSEDFKYLARKLTYGLTEKEIGRKKKGTCLEFTDSVRTKVKEYIRQYMKKFGPVYRKI